MNIRYKSNLVRGRKSKGGVLEGQRMANRMYKELNGSVKSSHSPLIRSRENCITCEISIATFIRCCAHSQKSKSVSLLFNN